MRQLIQQLSIGVEVRPEDNEQQLPLAGLLRSLVLAILLLSPCLPVSAQTQTLFPANQAPNGISGWFSQQRPGQYRTCSPADFGDPNADCIPASNQFGTNTYAAGQTDPFSMGNDIRSGIPQPTVQGGYPERTVMDPEMMRTFDQSQTLRNEKEPPTEFQKYVEQSTGQLLPIYGASLFERVPATFAPMDRAAVGADYRIAVGDVLQIAVWGQVNLTRRYAVDRNGQLILPDVGPLSVIGMTESQAASVVKAAMSHLYKSFDVSVTLAQLHSLQVFVVGEARRPGSYTVSSLSTLVNTIFVSGGPSSRGSMRDIELKRADRTIRHFDLYQLLTRGDKSQDEQLSPGDVIVFRPAGPRIAVAGSVEHAGIYEVGENTTLREALSLADGLSPLASQKQVVLERISANGGLEVEHLAMGAPEMATKLRNGDIIRLLPIVPQFASAVTLRGNVANPGRFPWNPGMRVSDLIPSREVLLTRDYWKAKNALANPSESLLAENVEPESQNAASAGSEQVNSIKRVPGVKNYREENRNLQGDSSLGASTEASGNVPPIRTFTPRNIVQPSVPDINWSYAVVERTDPVTLVTHTVPFDLGKAISSRDPKQDLELQRGDVVTIFSTADFSVPQAQRAIQVRVEGEVAMAGTYTALPGETLRQIVARAGGLTPKAYLYGAQFTRESTRREQQKRYDDFLDQLEHQINEAASNLSTRITSPQQALTAQTSLSGQRTLVERLRQTSLNGRIVLNVNPEAAGIQALPDLPLENGDRLYIPSRPSTVNVIGDVFEQASFLQEEDYRTGDYLKKAGGPTRSADRSHMFVIRADGSVVSRTRSSLFAKSFDALPMSPGDTLIVPTYINRSTFTRNLIDWSQIFSNFALGAAAVNILH